MKLVLFLKTTRWKEWPVVFPVADPLLTGLENFEARKKVVDDMMREKRIELAKHLDFGNHHFHCEATANFPPDEEVEKPKPLQLKFYPPPSKAKTPEPIKVQRPKAEYSNRSPLRIAK